MFNVNNDFYNSVTDDNLPGFLCVKACIWHTVYN